MWSSLWCGYISLKFVGFQWVQKRVSVELVMAFHTDLESAISCWAGDTKDNITVLYLSVVERNLRFLIDVSGDQPGRTAYATAIFATVWKVHALSAQTVQPSTM